MKSKLGSYETQLLAYVQMRGEVTIETAEVTKALRISTKQASELLSRLVRTNLIARVRRGLYLVPPRFPLGGKWSPSEGLAIDTLMKDQRGIYQICGPSAFNRYGFDEQIPNRIYVYNNTLSGERKIGAVSMTLIRVSDQRLGSTEEIVNEDNILMAYSSRVRTLVDAIYDWSRFNGLPRGFNWIRKELAAKRVSPSDLVNTTLRYGDKGTIRRMGVLLDMEGIEEPLLKKLIRALEPSKALIPWIPGFQKGGKKNSKWGVLVNNNVT